MNSQLVDALKLKSSPVAVVLTHDKPGAGVQFKEGTMGCVAAMLVAASKGRTAFFDRKTFGCPGGGTGLGFGNVYQKFGFPIECLLSTGNKEFAAIMGRNSAMEEGERYFKSPELARNWAEALPFREVPTDYVVFKPLSEVSAEETPVMVTFLVNADQLSALIVMSGYYRRSLENVTVPFGAACQSILFGYAEAEKENPRGIIGFFDISQRKQVDKDILSFTLPYKIFLDIEENIPGSFLETEEWQKIQERQF